MFGEKRKYVVNAELAGGRVDKVLSELVKDVSRQYLQRLVKEGRVWSGKKYLKPSYKVSEGEVIMVDFPVPVKMDLEPVEMPLKVVYEDEYLVVINKDAGMVVHPAEHGKFMGQSLVNAALAYVGEGLKGIGGVLRPGIVHRLDKDTSGLIIVAKTDLAHQRLVDMFRAREVKKKYMALVCGKIEQDKGKIVAGIGRSSRDRKKMAVDGMRAKDAVTGFVVQERYFFHKLYFSLVEALPETGRTHQIRVHLASIGHPIVGDKVYGVEKVNEVMAEFAGLKRQFLHAYSLSFPHPITQKKIDLVAGLSSDLTHVLEELKGSRI